MERILPSAPDLDDMVAHTYDTRPLKNSSPHINNACGVSQAYVYVPNSSITYEGDPSQEPLQNRSKSQMSPPSRMSPNYYNNKDCVV